MCDILKTMMAEAVKDIMGTMTNRVMLQKLNTITNNIASWTLTDIRPSPCCSGRTAASVTILFKKPVDGRDRADVTFQIPNQIDACDWSW